MSTVGQIFNNAVTSIHKAQVVHQALLQTEHVVSTLLFM